MREEAKKTVKDGMNDSELWFEIFFICPEDVDVNPLFYDILHWKTVRIF